MNNIFILPIGGEEIDKLSLNVSENGNYEAAEGTAYTEVSVNVPDIPAVTETLSVTENGTYTTPSGVDGFSEVVVNVPDIPAVTEPLNVTENGTYTTPSGVDGFSEVTVNVPDIPAVTEPLNVTENGTYIAPSGVDGFSEVTVNVPQASVVTTVNSVTPLGYTSLQVDIYIASNQTITSYGVDYSTDNFQNYQSVSKEGNIFGEEQFTIQNLTQETTYQLRCFVIIDGVRYDKLPYTTILTASTPVYPAGVPTKSTIMTTTDLSTSLTVTMGSGSTDMPDENFYVYWGDGSDIQQYDANTSATVSHTYAETGLKIIHLWSESTTDTEYGKMPQFRGSSSGSWSQIERIETPLQKIYGGSTHYTADDNINPDMFLQATELKFVCDNLFENYCDPTIKVFTTAFRGMFQGCTSLTVAPALPATTLSQSCYHYMFKNCTSLTKAPALPATTLGKYCYAGMFQGCTSLTEAPSLPATTLAYNCYEYMFDGCSALKEAPVLPAKTFAASYCYQYMFRDCISLESVTIYATQWSSSNISWLEGAGTSAENPTIYCPANSTIKNYTNNNDGIPTGWTQVDL